MGINGLSLKPAVIAVRWLMLSALLLGAQAAFAAETIGYGYDALGRLIEVGVSGGPSNGVETTYVYDASGNRSRVTVTGAGSGASCSFSIGDASVDARSGAPLEFLVSRTGTCPGLVTLSYATQNGSAVAPTHYTAATGSIGFSTSESAKIIAVQTTPSHDTATLYMYVNISLSSGTASIVDGQGSGELVPD